MPFVTSTYTSSFLLLLVPVVFFVRILYTHIHAKSHCVHRINTHAGAASSTFCVLRKVSLPTCLHQIIHNWNIIGHAQLKETIVVKYCIELLLEQLVHRGEDNVCFRCCPKHLSFWSFYKVLKRARTHGRLLLSEVDRLEQGFEEELDFSKTVLFSEIL